MMPGRVVRHSQAAGRRAAGRRLVLVVTTLGLIGSGHIGGTLARLAVDNGLDVVLSNSRGPQTLAGLAAELGPRASAGTGREAAAAGDWVVVTIPVRAYPDVPRDALAGKTVLDTGNYYPQRDGNIAELDSGGATSSGLLQRHLDESYVVKAFNNIFFRHLLDLSRPAGAADRTALPIAGDDAGAKRRATDLLDRLGFDAVDAGALNEGRRFQPGTPAYGKIYVAGDPALFAQQPGSPAPAAAVIRALAAAEV
jgi:predicted dinucleotide-binding enzyme